jgi:membrane protein
MPRFVAQSWTLLRETVAGFIDDNALSHGAAMAFYAVTSLAPILLIVVAIAGLAFGNDAAQLALSAQISGLMGPESADLFKTALANASNKTSGSWATVVGLITLLITASGVFGEMQLSLNTIWKVEPKGSSVSRLVRARAASLGLVAALGFLLLVSLAASAAITAFGDLLDATLPFGEMIMAIINGLVSFVLIAVMFGAIYKLLPDRALAWRDVAVGAVVTAALFTIGKSLIGWYLGSSAVASSYGAAGGVLVTLLWVYYSSEIFLLGAEFTRAYSVRHGSRRDLVAQTAVPTNVERLPRVAPRPESAEQPGAGAIALMFLAWASAAVIGVRSHRASRRWSHAARGQEPSQVARLADYARRRLH